MQPSRKELVGVGAQAVALTFLFLPGFPGARPCEPRDLKILECCILGNPVLSSL